MNLVMDFVLHTWRTLGPTLLIMAGVVIAYASGGAKFGWGIIISAGVIGVARGWAEWSGEVRGKEKLLTAIVEAGREKAGGGE